MDKIQIQGGNPCVGEVELSGAKNSALPILISTLLTSEPIELRRVPDLQDIETTMKLLEALGSTCASLGTNQWKIQSASSPLPFAPYDIVRKMRASVLVLGPLLARCHEAKVSLPGGCAIGARPVDIHLDGLRAMGASLELEDGYVIGRALGGLRGVDWTLPFPSVGATENLIMAAALARGTTVFRNVAQEPEIVDLAKQLRSMGANISGEGSSVITLHGVQALHGSKNEVMADRIEAGTYLIAGLITGGDVKVTGINPDALQAVLDTLSEMGAILEMGPDWVRAKAPVQKLRAISIETAPFPGFPTDMQAQFMALLLTADGDSTITEKIFENRFMHVSELQRLGADIQIKGNTAMVHGGQSLKGAPVMATDLRASASLVLAGLIASGETIVNRVYHLDRGYERLEEKLSRLGANIVRVKG